MMVKALVLLAVLVVAPFPGAALAASETPRILIVATSHADVPGSGKRTGLWLSELIDPYWVFREAGAEVRIATVKGGPAPIDPRSGGAGDLARAFRNDPVAMDKFTQAPAVDAVDASGFDAVFFAGGHGTMWDFAENATIARMVSEFVRAGKVVGSVCHGPAALLSATDAEGRPVVAGKRITAFTDGEEAAAGWTDLVPYSLEQRLKAQGAVFEGAGVFRRNAVRDGTLVTGQNPASADDAAKLVLEALRERARSAT
jgi:putative intracellular protease/amidase